MLECPGADIIYFSLASGHGAPPALVPLLSCAQAIDTSRKTKRSLLDHILERP